MQSATPKKGRWTLKSAAGTMAVIGIAAAPFLSSLKSDLNIAKRNEAGQPSICFGHTKNVKMTDRATEEQCQKYLEEDYTDAITFVIKQSPLIAERTEILKTATHYVFAHGQQSYLESPMLSNFKESKWEEGCKAFVGYNVAYRYKFKKIGRQCEKLIDGTWLCQEPSLVAIRSSEMKMCLTPVKRNVS